MIKQRISQNFTPSDSCKPDTDVNCGPDYSEQKDTDIYQIVAYL